MPRTHIARRTSVFSESVIREMTRLAMLHGAMNLAQGYPDFPAPAFIKQAAVDAINADINQYAITWGAPRLRRAIADKTRRFYGLEVDPDREVTVTCGATEAMMCAMLAVVEEGDEVIVFEPFYENYVPDAAMSGARLVFVTLRGEGFSFDPGELRRAFSPRTRAIIVNTPNNPSGKVFTRAELQQIAALCQEFDTLCITDEIYEHILYDGREHIPMATLPGMYERTITISGLSKTFSVTGWRLGYLVAPPHLTDALRKVHDFLTVGAPAPLQEAAAVAIEQADAYYPELREMYAAKRAILLEALRAAGEPGVPDPYTDERIALYVRPKVVRQRWEEALLARFGESAPERLVDASKVKADQGSFILCLSYYDFHALLDIGPDGGTYIYSSSEAYDGETLIDHQRVRSFVF
ncbi:MAG: aminotransferase class I/II-fold pyridoxal phosphate-dependent enzyme [Dehalococcoidia bacterium]|nr:aminotransferase class I/II-fold pyridoxal phosphate-dependent enzyme [Dehalococcoidia bacterium]